MALLSGREGIPERRTLAPASGPRVGDGAAYLRDQVLGEEWLGQVIVGAKRPAALARLLIVEGRDDDHRQGPHRTAAAKLLVDLEARDVRQHQVEQDRRRPHLGGQLQRLPARDRPVTGKALLSQELAEQTIRVLL